MVALSSGPFLHYRCLAVRPGCVLREERGVTRWSYLEESLGMECERPMYASDGGLGYVM
ncbi:hypothetical protein GCM10023238_15030 [Streptomyces heliomycini]